MKRGIAKSAPEKLGVAQAKVGQVTVCTERPNVFRLLSSVQKGSNKRRRVTGTLSIPEGSAWPGDWAKEAYRAYLAADGRNGQKLDFNWANLEHWRGRIPGRRGLPLPTPRMDAVALAEWKSFNRRLKEVQGDAYIRVRFSKKDWMKLSISDRKLNPSVLMVKKQALVKKQQFYFLGDLTQKEISDKLSYYRGKAKLEFRRRINDKIPKNLQANTMKALGPDIITLGRVRAFARRCRDFMFGYMMTEEAIKNDTNLANLTGYALCQAMSKVRKCHRNIVDIDVRFLQAN